MSAGVKLWIARNLLGTSWIPAIGDADGNIQVAVQGTPDVNLASSDITLDINDDTTKRTMAIAYDGSGNPEYVGEATIGSSKGDTVWRIFKITWDGSDNPTDIKWADGVATFTKEWDEKGTYSYS